MKQEIIDRINQLAQEGDPFLFVINYKGNEAYIRKLSQIDPKECLYDFEGLSNACHINSTPLPRDIKWQVKVPLYADYEQSFHIVKNNILAGNSFLTNLTCQVPVTCNLTLNEIFQHTQGKYKLLLKKTNTEGQQFVCFSPETFLRIKQGHIYSYPMKGTIDATRPHAAQTLMDDTKEAAEHATIVDLIRNDLSRVAKHVTVTRYRYIDLLHTNQGDILQTSSEVCGKLPHDYPTHLGQIIDAQLPAGSITGAPKPKTIDIIHQAEGYDRSYYTGIMGIYNQGELNSAVIIRYIESDAHHNLTFKAGGGITAMSQCHKEYNEVIQKVYLPIKL